LIVGLGVGIPLLVYQRQDRQSTQNYLQRKKYKEWYTNVKANDQLKIIYNEKNINKANKKICASINNGLPEI
jgi:deoxyadenosine/deoxycytidine kinase